jgi:hypothetical protein
MPSFEKEFREAKGVPIKYKNLELIRMDRIPVKKKFSGSLKIISTNSEYRQAVIIQADDRKTKRLTIESQKERSFIIWADEIGNDIIHFDGTSKNFELFVYNAWEQIAWNGVPHTNYWYYGAAMIVEINGNTRRYKCNDGHPDDNFDDIIFEVTIDEE